MRSSASLPKACTMQPRRSAQGAVEEVHDAPLVLAGVLVDRLGVVGVGEVPVLGEHRRLAGAQAAHRASASSKKPITRRSYSCGRASWPPMWSASGISHSVAEAPAAFA